MDSLERFKYKITRITEDNRGIVVSLESEDGGSSPLYHHRKQREVATDLLHVVSREGEENIQRDLFSNNGYGIGVRDMTLFLKMSRKEFPLNVGDYVSLDLWLGVPLLEEEPKLRILENKAQDWDRLMETGEVWVAEGKFRKVTEDEDKPKPGVRKLRGKK